MPANAELAAKLKSEGEKSMEYYRGLSGPQWDTQVYTEGSIWSIRNILAHLMTAERAFLELFENIRRGGAGVSEDFVIDRYNARQQEKTRELTPEELLRQYREVRGQMVNWVSGLTDVELGATGRHPFLGVTTLREMIKMVYIHNQTHYRDIRRVLSR